MNKALSRAVVVAGLVLTLGAAVSWSGPPPPTNNDVSDDNGNTAGGTDALKITTGVSNTAFGHAALSGDTRGYENTAVGDGPLLNNTEGHRNTAIGAAALGGNTTGAYNSAVGDDALVNNSTGSYNTAEGVEALSQNTTGLGNTASGAFALDGNTTGYANAATGYQALRTNTAGFANTATGVKALLSNGSGAYNTALGYQALNNSTGSRNLALGYQAGFNLSSGDKNIYLGSTGAPTESNTMRLGRSQTRTFITGIAGVPISGAQVTINNNGQLGIVASSARYKRDIHDMGEGSQGLYSLRPITFRYKQDPQGQRQYGLVAEEVAKVYPELVTKGTDGKVEAVQYHQLIPLLLNEVQHQQQEIVELKARLGRLEQGATRTAAAATR